jgi:prefoldin subunit 5
MNNQQLKDELHDVKEQLKILTESIKALEKQCSRMNGHIDFVEQVYSTLQTPLNLLKRISYIQDNSKQISN